MKKLLYLILLFSCADASAQYVSHGPRGGAAHSFYQDAARIWLAAGTGVYYSDNNGVTWHEPTIAPSAFNCDAVLSIAATGNELYAGTQLSGIYHSTDGGSTWSMVNFNLMRGAPYGDLAIIGPNTLAIRADSGILYMTPDHGASWVRRNFTINNAAALWLSVHNNALYVTTSQGLFKSMDNGVSYININPSVADIGELVWVNDTAYVGTTTGIKQSIDDGMTFTTIGLAGRPTQNVAVYGSSIFATVRSAANQDTLKYSTDGGVSFSNAAFPSAAPFSRVHDITIAGPNVLAGSNYGIYRSATGSGSFTRADSGFHATAIRSMAVNGLRLYAATSPMGIFYSPDSADTWIHNGDVARGIEGNMLAIDVKNQYVHAGGSANYYRSSDFGVTWTPGAAGLPPGAVTAVYAFKFSPDVLVIRNSVLYRSPDDGASFAPVTTGIPGGSVYLVTRADTSLFVAANTGLYKGNSSFAFTLATGISGQITSVVYRDTAYFAATAGGGLYMSKDGSNWTGVTITAPGTLPLKINALIVHGHGLVAATDDGLFSDSTGIWMRDSLQGRIVLSLAVMAGKVYAGTCGGVWTLMNLPPAPDPVAVAAGGGGAVHALAVYPNPSSGDFRAVLTTSKGGAGELILRDMMGRTMLQQAVALHPGRNELQVSAGALQLSAGVYLIQVMADNQVATTRIVLR